MKAEFDHYIKNYRKNLDDAIALSENQVLFLLNIRH